MRVQITEQDIRNMASKCVKLLTEDIISKNMNRARRYLESKGVSTHDRRQEIITKVREEVPNSRLANCKFLLGVTRMYMERQINSGNKERLNQTLVLIASDAHVNEYDYNLNGESAKTLIKRFEGAVAELLSVDKEKSNAKERTRNENYTIIPINSTAEASPYRKYTSWCVTTSQGMYNTYTSDGLGRFYFCLRKGFEKEPAVRGEGCPLDDYGLSMIAISIRIDGSLNTCTCRWNHDSGGNDHIMTREQIEDLLGVNFYKTFLPYTKEELRAKGVIPLDEFQDFIDKGGNIEKYIYSTFGTKNEYKIIHVNKLYNVITPENKLMFNDWLLGIKYLGAEWLLIGSGDSLRIYNLQKKEILPTPTLNLATLFGDSRIRVRASGTFKINIIFTSGKILIGDITNAATWPDYIDTGNYGRIINGNHVTCFNGDKILYGDPNKPETWLTSCFMCSPTGGMLGFDANMEGNLNLITLDGNVIYGDKNNPSTWLDDYNAEAYYKDKVIYILKNNKFNAVTLDGKILFGDPNNTDTWFDSWENVDKDAHCKLTKGKAQYTVINGELKEWGIMAFYTEKPEKKKKW